MRNIARPGTCWAGLLRGNETLCSHRFNNLHHFAGTGLGARVKTLSAQPGDVSTFRRLLLSAGCNFYMKARLHCLVRKPAMEAEFGLAQGLFPSANPISRNMSVLAQKHGTWSASLETGLLRVVGQTVRA